MNGKLPTMSNIKSEITITEIFKAKKTNSSQKKDSLLSNLNDIATKSFSNYKTAKYKYKEQINLSFQQLYESNEFNTSDLSENEIEMNYLLIGEETSINTLKEKKTEGVISDLNYNSEFESTTSVIFIINDADDLDKLRSVVSGLNLKDEVYNYKCSFIDDLLIEDNFIDLSPDCNEDINKYRVTKEDLSVNINNKLITISDNYGYEYTFGYRNSITLICAQTGNFKSTILNQIAISMIEPNNNLGLNCVDSIEEGKIIVIDTELNKNSIAIKYEEYLDKIDYYSLKGTNIIDMTTSFSKILNSYINEKRRIRALFIDSIIDFIADFNDNIQSSKLINDLERLTGECNVPIFISYQENTQRVGSYGNKPSGHLGSKLMQKAEAHYRICKKKDIVELIGIKNRYDKNFTLELEILENDKQYAYLSSIGIKIQSKPSKEKKKAQLFNAVEEMFREKEILSSKELESNLMTLLNTKERTAKENKKKAIIEGYIFEEKKEGKLKFYKRVLMQNL